MLYFRKVSWCSWLSHHLDVVRVPGSNPGGTILFFSITIYKISYILTSRYCVIIFFSLYLSHNPPLPRVYLLFTMTSILCAFYFRLYFFSMSYHIYSLFLPFLLLYKILCLHLYSCRPCLCFFLSYCVSSCSSAGSSVRLKI